MYRKKHIEDRCFVRTCLCLCVQDFFFRWPKVERNNQASVVRGWRYCSKSIPPHRCRLQTVALAVKRDFLSTHLVDAEFSRLLKPLERCLLQALFGMLYSNVVQDTWYAVLFVDEDVILVSSESDTGLALCRAAWLSCISVYCRSLPKRRNRIVGDLCPTSAGRPHSKLLHMSCEQSFLSYTGRNAERSKNTCHSTVPCGTTPPCQ